MFLFSSRKVLQERCYLTLPSIMIGSGGGGMVVVVVVVVVVGLGLIGI